MSTHHDLLSPTASTCLRCSHVAAMKHRSRYLISGGLLLSLYIIYLFTLHVDDDYSTVVSNEGDQSSVIHSQPKPPKITMIAIWVPRSSVSPIYLPYFFQSVEANPQVDLIFVQVDKFGVGCKRYSHARNVQVATFYFWPHPYVTDTSM